VSLRLLSIETCGSSSAVGADSVLSLSLHPVSYIETYAVMRPDRGVETVESITSYLNEIPMDSMENRWKLLLDHSEKLP